MIIDHDLQQDDAAYITARLEGKWQDSLTSGEAGAIQAAIEWGYAQWRPEVAGYVWRHQLELTAKGRTLTQEVP